MEHLFFSVEIKGYKLNTAFWTSVDVYVQVTFIQGPFYEGGTSFFPLFQIY